MWEVFPVRKIGQGLLHNMLILASQLVAEMIRMADQIFQDNSATKITRFSQPNTALLRTQGANYAPRMGGRIPPKPPLLTQGCQLRP